MRRTLLEWLVSVNRQFNYTLDTWCLTVDVMDRFLAKQPIHRDCLQLVGLVAFFIAAKMEETNPPEISELVSLCANSYEPKQVGSQTQYFFLVITFNDVWRISFKMVPVST